MTEPGGAGSDPGQLLSTATFDGGSYRINGLKWLITGANGAQTWIVMANVVPRVGVRDRLDPRCSSRTGTTRASRSSGS